MGILLEVAEGDVGVVEESGGVDALAGGGTSVGPVVEFLCCMEADVCGDLCRPGGGVPVAGGGAPDFSSSSFWGSLFVEGAVFQHDVAAASSQEHDGGVALLCFAAFSLVVGDREWVVAAGALGRAEEGILQCLVP